MVDLCITLAGLVKERVDDFRGFPKDKSDAQDTIGKLQNTLRYVSAQSLMSVASSHAESRAMSDVLEGMSASLKKLEKLIIYCERKPLVTTYIFPNKQRGKWQGCLNSIERDITVLNLCISHATKNNTHVIKEDTKELKSSAMELKTSAADNAHKMEEINAKLSALLDVVNTKKIEIDFDSVEESYATSVKAAEESVVEEMFSADELEAMINKARELENAGKYQDALSEYARYYAALQKQGMEKRDLATSRFYSELGDASEKQGKYDESLRFHRKALALRLAGLRPDDPDVASSYCGIGFAYLRQSKYDEAMSFQQKALKIRLAKLKPDHPDIGQSYHRIAGVYAAQGKYTEALELYQKALDIRVVALGAEHADVAMSYNNMANVYYSQGKYTEALELYQKALDIQVVALGAEHLSTKGTERIMELCRKDMNSEL